MHLISSNVVKPKIPFYLKAHHLARPDSLCFIFRKLRVNNFMTKGSLAAKFGCSEDYVAAVESGSKFPSLRFVLFCADLFGANASWVKSKYSKECIERFSSRLNKRLGLEETGGVK